MRRTPETEHIVSFFFSEGNYLGNNNYILRVNFLLE